MRVPCVKEANVIRKNLKGGGRVRDQPRPETGKTFIPDWPALGLIVFQPCGGAVEGEGEGDMCFQNHF